MKAPNPVVTWWSEHSPRVSIILYGRENVVDVAAATRVRDELSRVLAELVELEEGAVLLQPSRVVAGPGAMTYRELLQMIRQHADDHPDDEALDRGVVVRIATNDGDDLHVGGLSSISIDPGCTDKPALVLDANQDPDDTLDEDE